MKKFLAGIFAMTLLLTGCSGEDEENQAIQEMPTRVKAIKVLTTNFRKGYESFAPNH